MKEFKIMIISPYKDAKIEYSVVEDSITPESCIRRKMCLYSYGTKFVVKDDTGEINVFAKVHVNDATRGYTELIRLNHFNSLNRLFKLFELDLGACRVDNPSIEFAFKYGKIKPVLRQIIEYLYVHGEFVGNYSDLTKALGQKVSVCVDGKVKSGNEPNIRKYVLKLKKQHIVEVIKDDEMDRFVCKIRLTDNWTENI